MENIDLDVDDPIQHVFDDLSSDKFGDDFDSNSDNGDLDIFTAVSEWSISTSGMSTIQFTRTNTLLVQIPSDGEPIDWFIYKIMLYKKCFTFVKS